MVMMTTISLEEKNNKSIKTWKLFQNNNHPPLTGEPKVQLALLRTKVSAEDVMPSHQLMLWKLVISLSTVNSQLWHLSRSSTAQVVMVTRVVMVVSWLTASTILRELSLWECPTTHGSADNNNADINHQVVLLVPLDTLALLRTTQMLWDKLWTFNQYQLP
jgi:hypothetical protein